MLFLLYLLSLFDKKATVVRLPELFLLMFE